MTKPFTVKWKFRALLEREEVSVYQLAQQLTNKVSRVTLYRWNSAPPEDINITSDYIGWVLWGLSQLKHKSYSMNDLIEIEVVSSPDHQ